MSGWGETGRAALTMPPGPKKGSISMATTDSAKRIYDEAVVIDGLNVSNWESPAVYKSLHAGRVTAFNATVATWENFPDTLNNIAAWGPRFREYADVLTQVRTVDDILQAKRDGKAGVILGFQNASPIENHLDRLALFHALGVRVIQVTYHEGNLLGSGCYERNDYGLTYFGVDAVKEMNRLGILIDLSHVGIRTTMETIELSEKPVSVTHSNSKPYYDVPRNKTEEAVKFLAERGGVVGATCITGFLRTREDSTLEDYIDAIDDMVERIGVDHVGIGTDFVQDQTESFWRYINAQQGTSYPLKGPSQAPGYVARPRTTMADKRYHPKGLETPDKLPNLAEALMKRGYSADDITKILGGNFLRLFREVWEA